MLARNGHASAIGIAGRVQKKPLVAAAVAIVLSLSVSACAVGEPGVVRAANPDVALQPVTYNSAIRGYTSQRPVEPGNWQEQNQNVAPQRKR
jgi:hypothetical protein